MKKIIAFILSLALLTGCVKTGNNVEEGKLNVVASFFPAYDLVSRVGGEHVNVTNLTETGDAHTYEPSIKDMEAITKADLLVVNGAEFEPWIENIKTNNPDLKILELSEGIELMEGNHDHHHEHDNAETHDHNHDHHHEKITEKDVDDRQLIEFKGKWHSITEFIEDGTLNPLVEFVSLENKQEIKDAKSGLLNDFKTDYSEMEIKDNSIEIDGKEFKYSYDGFIFEDDHHHPHVWYKFKLLDETKDAPKYIVINDHGFKANQEKDPNHVDHIHLAYSNESFEDALEKESLPFYVGSNDKKEISDQFNPTKEELEEFKKEIAETKEENHDEHNHDHDHDKAETHDHDHDHDHDKAETHDHDHDHDHNKAETHDHDHDHDHDKAETHDHDHDHDHDKAETHDHEHHHHHGKYDPHTWLSLKNPIVMLGNIKDKLVEIDSAHKDAYNTNYEKAKGEFESFANEYSSKFANHQGKEFIVPHAAFGYLVKELGIKQIGIEGINSVNEPNAARMKEIVDIMNEHNIKTVFYEYGKSDKVANSISNEIGGNVKAISSLEVISKEDREKGDNYLSLMKMNLDNILDSFEGR